MSGKFLYDALEAVLNNTVSGGNAPHLDLFWATFPQVLFMPIDSSRQTFSLLSTVAPAPDADVPQLEETFIEQPVKTLMLEDIKFLYLRALHLLVVDSSFLEKYKDTMRMPKLLEFMVSLGLFKTGRRQCRVNR